MSIANHDRDHIGNGPSEGDHRLAGAAGVAFFVWMVIAAVVYAGALPMPAFSDPDSYHVMYFADHGTALALHAWLSGLFWVLGLLTFAAGLRRQLIADQPAAAMWADLAFAGALMATVVGGVGVALQTAASAVSGTAAQAVVPALGRFLAVIDQTLLYWGLALLVGAGSIAIMRSGQGTRRLGWLGLADAVILVVGAAWPLTGDDRNLLGVVGLVGLFVAGVWILWAAVRLLRARPAGADQPAQGSARIATGGAPGA